MEKHSTTFGSQTITFELHRKKVKHININTRPDLSVMVSADELVPISFIKKTIKKKAPLILKNICYFQNAKAEIKSKMAYVSGESFKYLGKQIRIKVEESKTEYSCYKSGYLFLFVKNKSDFRVKNQLFNTWIKTRTSIIFQQSLDKIFPIVESYGINKPSIKLRLMKARWGSCLKDKNIIVLNLELIKAPKYCINYVVLHELIHFINHNHDANFFNMLSALMPDWKERKKILDEERARNL